MQEVWYPMAILQNSSRSRRNVDPGMLQQQFFITTIFVLFCGTSYISLKIVPLCEGVIIRLRL